MQKSIIVDFRLGSKYARLCDSEKPVCCLTDYIYQTISPLHVAVIVYLDDLHLVTESSSHWKWSKMFLKILQNFQENACAGASTYQFNSQSMSLLIIAEAATGGILGKSVPKKFSKFHRKISVLGSLFNKVEANQACNDTQIRI